MKSGLPQVVSVLLKDGSALVPPPGGFTSFKLSTNTRVNFLSTHHDIVFGVDVSFSAVSSVSAPELLAF